MIVSRIVFIAVDLTVKKWLPSENFFTHWHDTSILVQELVLVYWYEYKFLHQKLTAEVVMV